MPEEPDIIDEELADEEAEPEEGLSDESREAIQRGADRLVNGKKEVPSDKSQVASGQTETQAPPKEIPDNKKDDLGSKYGDNKQGKLPANKTPDGAKPDLPPKTAPTAGGANAAANKLPQAPPSGSGGGGASGAAGAAGKAGQALQAGRIGADIAAHPREGAEEAGHAVAHQAGKKVAKEAGEAGVKWAAKQGAKAGIKGLADLATSGTIIVPVIIEASDFIIGKMANLPGAKGAIGWINKHKILVTIFVIFLFLGGPVLAFVAGAGGAGDTGGSSGIYAGGGTGIPNGTAMVNGVVLYKQGSGAPWAGHSYGGGTTIASSGCGVTSIAMVLATYGIDVNPADIADYSLNHGFRVYGSGTS